VGLASRGPRACLPGADDPLSEFPNLKACTRRRARVPLRCGESERKRNHRFKTAVDEETKRAMFPSNYPEIGDVTNKREIHIAQATQDR